MSAPPSTADAPEASPSCWSVRQLRDELARLGIDARGCVEERELVDLVVGHQQHGVPATAPSAPDGGQAAGSSGRGGPSEAPHGVSINAAMCENCLKRRRDGHRLFSCSGCKSVYYCSKECQNETWRNGGHKRVCKQRQAAKALMAEAGQAHIFAAFAKWLKKTHIFMATTAASALLYVGTSRIATHTLMLCLDYVPSMPLNFKVHTFEVLIKAELVSIQGEGVLPELSRWDLPGPDRGSTVVVMAGPMRQTLISTRPEEKAAGRAPGAVEPGSSGTAGPSEAPHRTSMDVAMCHNCSKLRRDGHKLFSCSGCKAVYYCSKECQNESWRNGGHKKICKNHQATRAVMAEAGVAEIFTAFQKWIRKMPVMLTSAAASSLVPKSRLATHAFVLSLDYEPSMPLQFKASPSCWSVRQLRDELARLGIDARGCVEKLELVDLVVGHQHGGPAAAAPSASDGGHAQRFVHA
ncbi:hypothetical protein FOA52_014701 [Chlamydomonas sp. UWO 241]|nr:hypothetical protein FOA52_014701 [Chlamydomonas sp. UWO 241]